MKYVMFQDEKGVMFPVIFDDHLTHSMVSVEGCKAISAGFVDDVGGCYGESTSLNLKADFERDSVYVGATLMNDQHTLNYVRIMEMVEKGEGIGDEGEDCMPVQVPRKCHTCPTEVFYDGQCADCRNNAQAESYAGS